MITFWKYHALQDVDGNAGGLDSQFDSPRTLCE